MHSKSVIPRLYTCMFTAINWPGPWERLVNMQRQVIKRTKSMHSSPNVPHDIRGFVFVYKCVMIMSRLYACVVTTINRSGPYNAILEGHN